MKKRRSSKDKTAVLVGVAGSHNACSLSLYNLKAFAYNDPDIRRAWDIFIIQSPLIGEANAKSRTDALFDEIKAAGPDLVGFSCYMWNMAVFRNLAGRIAEQMPDTRIVLGGPEITRDYIDDSKYDAFPVHFCVLGEGEQTFAEVLNREMAEEADFGATPGLAYRHSLDDPFRVNADRTPMKSLLEIPSPFLTGVVDDDVLKRKDFEANLETQRGCNLRCSYCIYHKEMSKITYSSIDRVLDEVRYIINKGVKKIRFVDANFSSELNHAKGLMKALIREKFEAKIMFELIPGFIDEELAALFGEYNALHPWNEMTLGIGVQTINPAVLKRMRRSIKQEKFETTFKLLQKNNVFAKIDLIIGLPGEDIKSVENTLEYMIDQLRSGQSHLLCCHVMRGLPGTELLDIARQDEMVFSSKHEPHEFIESPIMPRADMLKCLRRAGIVFRLVNHTGWADREFITGKNSNDSSICDVFFKTRDRHGISNIELVDLIVDGAMEELEGTDSRFVEEDFPFAETWWWTYSAFEIQNSWLIDFMTNIFSSSPAPRLAKSEYS